MTITQNFKEIGWNVIIKDDSYTITFMMDPLPTRDGELKITRMYCLRKDVFNYVLAIFENGTYRLYSGSKNKAKLYVKGPVTKLRFIPKLYLASRAVH